MDRLRKIGFSRLTSLEEALNQLTPHILITPIEEIEVSKSLDRILAEDVESGIAIPPFDRSAMDGYAVKAKDTFGSSLKNPKSVILVGKIEIGEPSDDKKLVFGEAIRISTGAAIPKGADSVIKIEDTTLENDKVTILSPIVPGKNVVKMGEDIQKGTKIMEKGTQLRAEHIALLTSLGLKKIKVRVKPKVSVFATGDELVEVGNILGKNKIFNSNSPMISNMIQQYGGTVIRESTLIDDKELLKNNLLESVKDSEIVIFTGGTSVGTKDYLPEVISESGVILTHGVAMRPGSPVLIGTVENKIIFCLPGTPVAAYVCFQEIAGPILRRMMKCLRIDPRIYLYATVSMDVPVSKMGFLNYLRVKLERSEDKYIAHPVKLKGSGIISSLTQSDGIIEIPPHQEGLKKNVKVLVKLFLR